MYLWTIPETWNWKSVGEEFCDYIGRWHIREKNNRRNDYASKLSFIFQLIVKLPVYGVIIMSVFRFKFKFSCVLNCMHSLFLNEGALPVAFCHIYVHGHGPSQFFTLPLKNINNSEYLIVISQFRISLVFKDKYRNIWTNWSAIFKIIFY